ncbi:MAG: phosphotransferase, partial [Bdellovibrio sp.]
MNFESFLIRVLKSKNFQISQLAGDASSRKYYRVILDQQSWVLMSWEAFHPEDYPFLSVQKHFLKNSVHVPEVIAMDPEHGWMLLEDLGDLTLERKFWENQKPEASMPFYELAIDE